MILKNKLKEKYTNLPNELIVDKRVKAGAFRVAVYLFSKPDGWIVNNSDIMKQLNIRQSHTLASYWRNLMSAGWITRERTRNDKGSFSGFYDYTLNDEKAEMVNNPNCGKTPNGENANLGKNHTHINPNPNTSSSFSNPESFSKGKTPEPTEKEILRTALKKQIGKQQFSILAKNENEFTGLGQLKFKLLIDWLEWKRTNKPYQKIRGLKTQVLSQFKIYDLPKIKRVVDFAIDKEHSGLNWAEDYKGQINYKNGKEPKPEVLKAAPASFVSPSSI